MLKLRTFKTLDTCGVDHRGLHGAGGDPSGRNKARPQLTHEQVLANAKTYTDHFSLILDPQRTEVVYNGTGFPIWGF